MTTTNINLNAAYPILSEEEADHRVEALTEVQRGALPLAGYSGGLPLYFLGWNVEGAKNTATTRWYWTPSNDLVARNDKQMQFRGAVYAAPLQLADFGIRPLSTQIKDHGGPGWNTSIEVLAFPSGKSQRAWYRLPSGLVLEAPNSRSLASIQRSPNEESLIIFDFDKSAYVVVEKSVAGPSGQEISRLEISREDALIMVEVAVAKGWNHHVDPNINSPHLLYPGIKGLPEYLLPTDDNRRRLFNAVAGYLEGGAQRQRGGFASTLDVVGQLYSMWNALEFEAGSVSAEFQQAGVRYLQMVLQGHSESFSNLEERLWSATGMFNQTVGDALNLHREAKPAASLSMG